MLLWKCDGDGKHPCPEEFPESGDRTGYGAAMAHLRSVEGKGHHILGLIDSGNGDLLVRGTNIKGAIAAGYCQPKDKDVPGEPPGTSRAKRESRAHALRRNLGGKKYVAEGHRNIQPPNGPRTSTDMGTEIPAPVSGVMTSYTLVFPPEMLGLHALLCQYMHRPDGSEFGWSPDDVNTMTWGVYREYAEFFIPRAMVKQFGYVGKMKQLALEQFTAVVRRTADMSADQVQSALLSAVADTAMAMHREQAGDQTPEEVGARE